MLRTLKITDGNTKQVKIFYISTCSKCGTNVLLPETYYAWYVRTLGVEPVKAAHGKCGGPAYDDYYHVSDWWETANLILGEVADHDNFGNRSFVTNEALFSVSETESELRYNEAPASQHDGLPITYVSYRVDNTFAGAYEQLQQFIVKAGSPVLGNTKR